MQAQSFDIPLQQINDSVIAKHNVNLYILRTDMNHPFISGNKLFKLKYNLEEAEKQNRDHLLTFGGAYSNHIAATAAAGKEYGFKTIGIIRGDKTEKLNPTLQFAADQGMKLYYVPRLEYKNKDTNDFIKHLNFQFPDSYIIPEGGANIFGIMGCKEITNLIKIPYDVIACACGTGTTLAGIVLSMENEQKAIGFQVLKGEDYIKTEVESWLLKCGKSGKDNWIINEGYSFGGYAKRSVELIEFIETFEKTNKIPLDFIYTGKMMFGIYDLIKKNHFKAGETIIAVHTGGLQGNAGFIHE
jgi:1-aminocyclopropane-1-carboxylate deaminase